VPRLCKIKLFPFSKSFGFSLDTLLVSATTTLNIGAHQTVTPPTKSYAHIVVKVEKNSPAATSSLKKGDRIIECNGVNVECDSEQQITDRIHDALLNNRQVNLFVVDPDTDNFFKSKFIKLHSMLPIVQHITNSTDI
jgi:C-terminal processing protease CtpA/Prc